MTRKRFTFADADALDPARLVRVLNDFALQVQLRLEAVEARGTELVTALVATGASGLVDVPPFPLRIATQSTPKSVTVVSAEPLQAPFTAVTSAPWLVWRPLDGGIEIRGCLGLAASTSYRLTLEVKYG